jgi:solute:Na+ symporter, SSS family
VLGVIVMIGIIAAAVSTIDSIMLTLSSMVARDVYGPLKADATELQQLAVGKFVIPVIAVLAFLFAQLKLDLIAILSVSASAGLLVVVPPIIGAFFWRRGTAPGVVAATVVAGGLVFVLELTGTKILGQGSGVWGLLVSVVLFVAISLATTAPTARAAEFMDHARQKSREHAVV